MKKLLSFALCMILVIAILAGCGSQQAPAPQDTAKSAQNTQASEPAKEKTYRFSLVVPIVGHPYFADMEAGAKAADKELGTNTELVGPTAVSLDEQIKIIETAIASKVDGIAMLPYNPEAFAPVIKKAKDAGIPLLTVDTDAPKSARDAYFGTSNRQAGIEAGKAMIKATGGKAKIGIITGALDGGKTNEIIDVFKETIKDQPGMSIVTIEASDADLLKATEKAQSMLKANPEITAFFGVSAADIVGAAKIVSEQKLTGKIKLVGFDDLKETLDYIRNGVIDATIVQKPYTMGYLAVKQLKEMKDGKSPAQIINDTGVTTVTKDNVDTYKNTK